jgi:hypothetical protein
MRPSRVDLQGAVLEELDAFMGTGHNRNNLIVIPELREVLVCNSWSVLACLAIVAYP